MLEVYIMNPFFVFILIIFTSLNPALAAAGIMIEPLETRMRLGGCIPSTEADWKATCGGMVDPTKHPFSLSAGSVHRRLSPEEKAAVTATESKSILSMTPAKNQGSIGSCTAFAIAACLECLVPGLTVSEAELFLRAKILGRAERGNGGSALHNYVALLREGVVREEDFISYDKFNKYVCRREYLACLGEVSSSEVLAVSDDFKTSLTDIVRASQDSKTDGFKPVWRVKSFPIRHRGMVECEVREGYWKDKMFNCFPLKTHHTDRSISPEDVIDYFKHILQTVPIAASVATFSSDGYYYEDAAGVQISVEDVWGDTEESNRLLKERGCMIDTPKGTPRLFKFDEILENKKEIARATSVGSAPPLKKDNGWHAICLCGYDNKRQAFRIKNSWKFWNPTTGQSDKPWADDGFAWLSYDYVKRYISTAMVILIDPKDTYIEPAIASSMDDVKARSSFESMLTAYKSSRR